jgi:leader peptidase (prepilin peptidase)/N-methyltransferase
VVENAEVWQWLVDSHALAGIGLVFGLLVGSFLNVVIHRLPLGESLLFPPSRCPACERPIRPWENVPVLAYLFLRGRCAGCGVHISLRYPVIESLVGLLFMAVVLRYGASPMAPVWCVFIASLVAAAAIDFDHQIIPDGISLGGLLFGLIAVPLVHSLEGFPLMEAVRFSWLGAAVGSFLLWIVGFLHARLSVALGREFAHWPGEGEELPCPNSLDFWTWFPGLGFGDVKLLAMIGAFVGVVGTFETLFVGSLVGLVFGLVSVFSSRNMGATFGFGPALAIAAIIVVLTPVPLHMLLFQME